MGYVSYVKEAKQEFDEWEGKALKAIGLFVEAEAKLRAPVGQYVEDLVGGNLRSSIGHKVDKSRNVVHIGTDAEYAVYVEKGTAPHLIMPKVASMLSWVDKTGKRIFAHMVKHPGTKAQPFLTPAVEDNINKIQQTVQKVKFANEPD